MLASLPRPFSVCVFGASGGIGASIASALANEDGVTVFAGSRSGGPEIPRTASFAFDLIDEASIAAVAAHVRDAADLMTFDDFLTQWAEDRPTQMAMREEDRVWSYADLEDRTARAASWMAGQGLVKGDRIGSIAHIALPAWHVHLDFDPKCGGVTQASTVI